jgi:hypothetical protein
MWSKAPMLVTILTLRSVPDAIRKHSLQPVEVAARKIRTPVGHESREMLPHSLSMIRVLR